MKTVMFLPSEDSLCIKKRRGPVGGLWMRFSGCSVDEVQWVVDEVQWVVCG